MKHADKQKKNKSVSSSILYYYCSLLTLSYSILLHVPFLFLMSSSISLFSTLPFFVSLSVVLRLSVLFLCFSSVLTVSLWMAASVNKENLHTSVGSLHSSTLNVGLVCALACPRLTIPFKWRENKICWPRCQRQWLFYFNFLFLIINIYMDYSTFEKRQLKLWWWKWWLSDFEDD